MKNLFLLTVLICSSIYWHNAGAQSVDWNAVEQHYFDVYQPTDTPQWIFPIIAINGDGQADTIYYCYKSYANDYNIYENEFGEKATLLDTSNFAFSFNYVLDSTYSVFAFGDTSFSGAENIGHTFLTFINGKYPLTLKWNGIKLYDTVLPFPNILPKPIARIGGFWGHYYLPFIWGTAETFIISDTAGIGSICLSPEVYLFIDSVQFDGPINASPDDYLGITLSLRKQSDGCIIGFVIEPPSTQLVLIDHIDANWIRLTSNFNEPINIYIFDVLGRQLTASKLSALQTTAISINVMPSIIYIRAEAASLSQTFKIINL